MNTVRLFAYGTLLNEEVWQRVVGDSRSSVEGWCRGYAAYCVHAADYPGLAPSDQQQLVAGRVYLDVDEEILHRLDTYEGDQYTRQVVSVECADGELWECWAYLWKPELSHLLTTTLWEQRETSTGPIQPMPSNAPAPGQTTGAYKP